MSKSHLDKYSTQACRWKIVSHSGKIWIEDQYIFNSFEGNKYTWYTCNKEGKCNFTNGWFVCYYDSIEEAESAREEFEACNKYEEL
jgi:hypothetical protein